ncbi:hypothetical protein ASF09_19030 [Sphingomonas sp. Leaf242]|nr:hypothetical protein ASF09_19030 [Sphingomonas sp. Leaf242]
MNALPQLEACGTASDEMEAQDWSCFRQQLEAALAPQQPYLTDLERAMYAGGKKVRPRVMMLSARLMNPWGPLSDKVYKGAAAVEMLHVATLIHDDIVDEAPMRRGLPSIAAARGTKTAVLIGDLQFVQAIRAFASAVDTDSDMALTRRVLDAAFDLCCGELDEFDRTLPEDRVERIARYYRTIDRKTGVLFRLACSGGVELAGGRTREARRAGFVGRSIGRAFQIMDDVRDIVELDQYAGKAAGADLIMGRHSLPLLHAVDALGTDCTIARAMRGDGSVREADLDSALDEIRDCGAIDAAYAAARREAMDALFFLQPFAPTPARAALSAVAMEIVDRPLNR